MSVVGEDMIRLVKDRVSLWDVAGQYIAIDGRGKALCPFHEEANRSFSIHPNGRRFRCFGCGASGDVIDFYGRITGKAFKEAVQELAAKLRK